MPRPRPCTVAFILTLAPAICVALPPPAPTPVPGPPLTAYALSASRPTIDGQVGAAEWPYAPQIVIDNTYPATYVRPTYATFVNDHTTLYVLVDAVGDTTADSPCDECFLVFHNGSTQTDVDISLALSGTPVVSPVGVVAVIGFGPSPNSATDHRIYEFAIPLSVIGATPGSPLSFCSPAFNFKTGCAGGSVASMPFDGSTTHDNVWPPGTGFSFADPRTWSAIALQENVAVPSLGRAGLAAMILVVALAGLGLLRRCAG
jgi:hypothetical protein